MVSDRSNLDHIDHLHNHRHDMHHGNIHLGSCDNQSTLDNFYNLDNHDNHGNHEVTGACDTVMETVFDMVTETFVVAAICGIRDLYHSFDHVRR